MQILFKCYEYLRHLHIIRRLVLYFMKILNIIQIVIAGLLVTVILLQSQGAGLSQVFGGGGGGEAWRTKRGLEKFLFTSTIVLAVLFLALSLVRLFI